MKKYFKRAIINFPIFVITKILLDYIFRDEIVWKDVLLFSLFFAFIVVPLTDLIMKKLKI
jgi:hypothetical protein